MITISQCSNSTIWEIEDRLCFQIYNGVKTTYVRSNVPSRVSSLGERDFNSYDNDAYIFYYKEKE